MARRWDVWACDVDGATVIFLVRMAPASALDGSLLRHKYEMNAEGAQYKDGNPPSPSPRVGRALSWLHFSGWPKKIVGPKRQRIR